MGKVIRLTESQLKEVIKKVIEENETNTSTSPNDKSCLKGFTFDKGHKQNHPPYRDIPDFWSGTYNGKKVFLYNEGIGKYYTEKFKYKFCNWKCENGRLILYNFSEERIQTYD